MKKKTKIILFSIIGVLIIAAVAVGVIFALNSSESIPTGTVVAGTGEYEWRKTEVHINLNTKSNEKYYSNCTDDGIYDLSYNKCYESRSRDADIVYQIEYQQDFNIADDMYVFFVLSDGANSYITRTEKSELALGPEWINIPLSEITDDYYIKEIWVMTED